MFKILLILTGICSYIDGFRYIDNEANIKDFPYQVSVQYKFYGGRQHICGGVIISEKYVLTSAKCFKNNIRQPLRESRIYIKSGMSNLSDASEGVYSKVKTVIIHEDFRYNSKGMPINDIALVELEDSLNFDDNQQAVSFTNAKKPNALEIAQVTGWGKAEKAQQFDHLHSIKISITDKKICEMLYKNYLDDKFSELEDKVCAKGLVRQDNCVGDVGGPLVLDNVLIGITSWGTCGFENYPVVYTSIKYYRDWIEQQIS